MGYANHVTATSTTNRIATTKDNIVVRRAVSAVCSICPPISRNEQFTCHKVAHTPRVVLDYHSLGYFSGRRDWQSPSQVRSARQVSVRVTANLPPVFGFCLLFSHRPLAPTRESDLPARGNEIVFYLLGYIRPQRVGRCRISIPPASRYPVFAWLRLPTLRFEHQPHCARGLS